MATLIKQWPTGTGNLSVTYDGDGDGSAVFSSDTYEGIDREMEVDFVGGGITQTRKVRQEGIRQPIGLVGGGIFRVANGGRFGVLKEEKPYTEVEYIEATGEQWIDTQLPSSVKSSVDVVFSFSSMAQAGANNAAVFGGRAMQTSNTFTLSKIASMNPQCLRFDYNGQRQVATSTQMSWEADHKYRFTYDGVTGKTVNLVTNEVVSSNIAPSNLVSIYPIALFAVNTKGTRSTFMKGRIYQFTYSDGETHIDLIPVIDKDGVACMYDKVSGEFFYNKGTGQFIAGNIK